MCAIARMVAPRLTSPGGLENGFSDFYQNEKNWSVSVQENHLKVVKKVVLPQKILETRVGLSCVFLLLTSVSNPKKC